MDLDETMVENEAPDTEVDDTLPESIEEVPDESEESLESLMGTEEEPKGDEEPAEQPQEQQASEPGWIKKRVDKAVNKAVAEALAKQKAEFEEQMAPIREKLLTDEAKELVRQGEFKSLDRAKEYLRLKQGMPAAQTGSDEQEQPRNANGQFAPKEDPTLSVRVNMLAHQADAIKAKGGPDVIAEFKNNKEINEKVKSGEMDFYDVAEYMKQPKAKKPPAPMRSPNGASNRTPTVFDNMSDEQFDRLEKRIKEGARYSLR